MRPGREVVTRIRRTVTGRDPYGNDVTSEARTDIDGCSVQPVTSAEVLGSSDQITTRWALFAPAGTDLAATDAVEHRGVRYEVDGDVMPWDLLSGRGHHVEAYLRKWTG